MKQAESRSHGGGDSSGAGRVASPAGVTERVTIGMQVVWNDVEGSLVLYDSAADSYYGLNDIGSEIWRLTAANVTVSEIVVRLRGVHDAESGTIEADVRELVGELLRLGLLVEAGAKQEHGA